MKKVLYIGLPAALLIPTFAFAQALGNVTNLVTAIRNIVSNILPIVFTLILVYFFWGLAVFVLNAGDDDKRKAGKNMMLWGIVALFVASSIWGIVRFIGSAIGGEVNQTGNVNVPGVGNSGGF